MRYELWTFPSGNLIDDFDTESDALALVREMLDDASVEAAGQLMLIRVNADGSGEPVASGTSLADRAVANLRQVN
jgi:hypothetical protein